MARNGIDLGLACRGSHAAGCEGVDSGMVDTYISRRFVCEPISICALEAWMVTQVAYYGSDASHVCYCEAAAAAGAAGAGPVTSLHISVSVEACPATVPV